jgi:non-ribosomal peptide synthetase component E (peptide arylation enzyme)
VEDIMLSDPLVQDVAVVAYPDTRMGEIVCAYVVAQPGAMVTLDTVRAHFAQNSVARQKTPERIVLVDEFPRTSTGKVLKHELRARARAEAKEQTA